MIKNWKQYRKAAADYTTLQAAVADKNSGPVPQDGDYVVWSAEHNGLLRALDELSGDMAKFEQSKEKT